MMKKIHEITELLGLYCGVEPLSIILLQEPLTFLSFLIHSESPAQK